MMQSPRLLALIPFALLTYSSHAADRVLDVSSGCKVYRLQNKAWVAEESAPFNGMQLSNSQIVKNEKFTVFRTSDGTFGVNEQCVKAGVSEPRPRPVAKRQSAAKPKGPSLLDNRGPWAASVSLGLNISPKGTTTFTDTATGVAKPPVASAYTGSITFIGEASYRFSPRFRLAGEIGVSQLQESSSVGNETSFLAFRPEFIFRSSPVMEFYVGPTLGVFLLAENASTGSSAAGETFAIKQQTAATSLLGLLAGTDYAISDQFDVGVYLRYFKPGSLKTTLNQTTPTVATVESVRTASYIMFGARFQIHF